MKRTFLILLATSCSLLGCDAPTPNSSDGSGSANEQATQSSPVNIDDRFIGSWKYFGYIPDDNPSDHSMDGIICELEKYKNTQKTYVFHLYTGNDLILSIKDDSTLIGENADMAVHYRETNGHLVLDISSKSKIVFMKLK